MSDINRWGHRGRGAIVIAPSMLVHAELGRPGRGAQGAGVVAGSTASNKAKVIIVARHTKIRLPGAPRAEELSKAFLVGRRGSTALWTVTV